jgi:glycosyltransferase involved in cell wall biosynthesis
MNSSLVSIIVPVFNEGPLLRECLESVVRQSLQDIEIIIVDDASTDNSRETIDEFLALDRRIKLLTHDINKGLGEARNTGMAEATGKYIYFLDSDDFLPLDSLEILTNIAETHDSEIVIGKAVSRIDVNAYYVKCDLFNVSISNYPDLLYNHSAWNKLIKLETLKNSGIRFVPPRYAEDILFSLKLNMYCKAISITTRYTYHYRWGRQIHSATKEKLIDAQGNVIRAYKYVEENGDDFLLNLMKKKTARNIYGNMHRAVNTLNHEDLVKYLGNWNQVIDYIPDTIFQELPGPNAKFCRLIAEREYDKAIASWKMSMRFGFIRRLNKLAAKILKRR